MKKQILLTAIVVLVSMKSAALAQDFRIGWYSPDDHSSQVGFLCNDPNKPNPQWGAPDGSSSGSFASVGINTLLAYKHGIYQVYNGNAWPMNLTTLRNNTESFLAIYPSQKVILDISTGTIDNPIFRNSSDITTYVNQFKNRSQVIGWYIADEPEGAWADESDNDLYYDRTPLVNRYNLIKSLSTKNVFVAVANTLDFRNKYGDGTMGGDGLPRVAKFYDILMADHYPVMIDAPWTSILGCRTQAQYAKSLVENDANVSSSIFYFIAQGQGFNEDNNNGSCGDYNMTDPDMHQMRYMVVSPMIWGAKGILFWSYANASRRGNNDNPADSWKTVHRFTQWFKASSFHGNLGNMYGTTAESAAPQNDSSWIHYRTKTYSNLTNYKEYYIFSVNENANTSSGFVLAPAPPSTGSWSRTAWENQYNASNPIQTYDVVQPISANNRISPTSGWMGYEVKIFRLVYQKLSKESALEDGDSQTPSEYFLHNGYPNPFNPSTKILFDLPRESEVKLIVYDSMGHEIRKLVSEIKAAGTYSVFWDGKDEVGQQMSSGIYLLKMKAATFTANQKLVLLR